MTHTIEPIASMNEQELRDTANQCELDLIEAATLAPQSERHVECYKNYSQQLGQVTPSTAQGHSPATPKEGV